MNEKNISNLMKNLNPTNTVYLQNIISQIELQARVQNANQQVDEDMKMKYVKGFTEDGDAILLNNSLSFLRSVFLSDRYQFFKVVDIKNKNY